MITAGQFKGHGNKLKCGGEIANSKESTMTQIKLGQLTNTMMPKPP
jgi:hypothetical protein